MSSIRLKRTPDSDPFSEKVARLKIPAVNENDGTEVLVNPCYLMDVSQDPIKPIPYFSPTVFKSAVATSGTTDIWTPAAGKRFRLLRVIIDPSGGLAAAGTEIITLLEETLGSFGIAIQTYLPIAASVAHQVPIVVDLGPSGYLATTVDKKFQVSLSAACTAGGISITAMGTEE